MTAEELKHQGPVTFGNGWQTRLAEALGRDGSTVRRWVSGTIPVPPYVDAYFNARIR